MIGLSPGDDGFVLFAQREKSVEFERIDFGWRIEECLVWGFQRNSGKPTDRTMVRRVQTDLVVLIDTSCAVKIKIIQGRSDLSNKALRLI